MYEYLASLFFYNFMKMDNESFSRTHESYKTRRARNRKKVNERR